METTSKLRIFQLLSVGAVQRNVGALEKWLLKRGEETNVPAAVEDVPS